MGTLNYVPNAKNTIQSRYNNVVTIGQQVKQYWNNICKKKNTFSFD